MGKTHISENTIYITGRIDQIVRDYFLQPNAENPVRAKNLMPLFIKKGVFSKDSSSRPGLPIRNLLRELDAANKLMLLLHCEVHRKRNRQWYFSKKMVS